MIITTITIAIIIFYIIIMIIVLILILKITMWIIMMSKNNSNNYNLIKDKIWVRLPELILSPLSYKTLWNSFWLAYSSVVWIIELLHNFHLRAIFVL